MANNILGRLAVFLGVNTDAFEQGLGRASKEANKAAREITKGFREAGDSFDKLLGPLGALGDQFSGTFGLIGGQISTIVKQVGPLASEFGALGALGIAAGAGISVVGAAAAALAVSGAETVEQIEHLSEKTGISTEDLVAWGAVAKANGTNLETFQIGVRRLEVAMSGLTPAGKVARQVLQEIGVTAKDPQEALLQVADAFQKMPDGANKAATAVAIFGRSGTDMIPILDKGRGEIIKWQEQTKGLAAAMENAAGSAQRYEEESTKLHVTWETTEVAFVGLIGALGAIEDKFDSLLPKATEFSEKMRLAVSGFLGRPAAGDNSGFQATSFEDQFRAAVAKQKADQAAAQDAGIAGATEEYERAKARVPIAFQLAEAQKEIAAEIASGKEDQIKLAASQERGLPLLREAAALQLKMYEAQQLAAQHAKYNAAPSLATGPTAPMDFSGGPNIAMQLPAMLDSVHKPMLDLTAVMDGFNDMFSTGVQHDIEKLETMNNSFEVLIAQGQATRASLAPMFNQVADALEHANFELAKMNGTVTFQMAFQNMFQTLTTQSKNFALSLTGDLMKALDQVNAGLAKLVFTGKGFDAKKIFQGMGESMFSSLLKSGEGSIFGALGLGGGKHDGSSSSSPLYTQDVSLGGALGSGQDGLFGSFFSNLTSGFSTMFSQLKNTFSTLFQSIGSMATIGGFMADGGVTAPGLSYIVGENGPELFTPGSSGTVTPNAALRSSHSTVYQIDARGADAGAEMRIRAALRDTEDRAVIRSVASVSEMNRRRPG